MEKRTDVQVSRTHEGVVVSITSKPSWVDRFVALFLSVWLVGWLFGEVSVIAVLVRGVAVSDLGARALVYGFLVLWLTAWTMGGFFVASTLSWMFLEKPSRSPRTRCASSCTVCPCSSCDPRSTSWPRYKMYACFPIAWRADVLARRSRAIQALARLHSRIEKEHRSSGLLSTLAALNNC